MNRQSVQELWGLFTGNGVPTIEMVEQFAFAIDQRRLELERRKTTDEVYETKARDMNLLDLFAAVVLHARLSSPSFTEVTSKQVEHVAREAYTVASAMLKQKDFEDNG